MSLPTHGQLTARAPGLELSFDGQTWTGSGRGFQFVKPDLDAETRRHTGQHITLNLAAQRILEAVFPGQWTIESYDTAVWKTKLPTGAVD